MRSSNNKAVIVVKTEVIDKTSFLLNRVIDFKTTSTELQAAFLYENI